MCMRAWAQLFTHTHLDFYLNLHNPCNTARHTVSTEHLAPHSHQSPYLCSSLEPYSLQQFRTNAAPQRRSLWIPSSSPRGLFQPWARVQRDRDLQQRWGSQEVERHAGNAFTLPLRRGWSLINRSSKHPLSQSRARLSSGPQFLWQLKRNHLYLQVYYEDDAQ